MRESTGCEWLGVWLLQGNPPRIPCGRVGVHWVSLESPDGESPSWEPSPDGESPSAHTISLGQGGVRINLHHAHFPNYTAIRSLWGWAFFGWGWTWWTRMAQKSCFFLFVRDGFWWRKTELGRTDCGGKPVGFPLRMARGPFCLWLVLRPTWHMHTARSAESFSCSQGDSVRACTF